MKYDLSYFEQLLRIHSATAEKINLIRWTFVKCTKPKKVLDYGSGIGAFRAWRPKGVVVDTYDIGPFPQTGIRRKKYDLVCFWDVLEHLPNFKDIEQILYSTKYIALTVPIKPKNIKLENWKHFKPGEHLHYFTEKILDLFFKKYGFKKIKKGYPECPPRQDILSVIYEKEK